MRTHVLILMMVAGTARADRPGGLCVDVSATFVPEDQLQIVAWVEDAQGHFIDTVFITSKVGRYGLGNRPGRFDFNSGSPLHDSWPYGRRITTFPVWAHRHGQTFPLVVSQDGDDNQLSHPFNQSSPEDTPPFCMPMLPESPNFDAITCASVSYSDKGVFSASQSSLYPPRADVMRQANVDSASVDMYRAFDTFDAISQATPLGGLPAVIHWAAPPNVDLGDYVLWVEVAKAYDTNATYGVARFPSPTNIPYSDYGLPYRGQPSVVYRVPFRIDSVATSSSTTDYIGYGDPDGADGALRAPDTTITTAADRFGIVAEGGYRVRVDMQPSSPSDPPAAPSMVAPAELTSSTATITFVEQAAHATRYDVRIRAEAPITDDNFATSTPVTATIVPGGAGAVQTVPVTGLIPETTYWIAIRAEDSCFDHGPLAVASFTTPASTSRAVDACFVATAAYGSLLAGDVQLLRRFRDRALRSNVLGELAVEMYYTVGPAAAAAIAPSELLRATARAALAPVVDVVKSSLAGQLEQP